MSSAKNSSQGIQIMSQRVWQCSELQDIFLLLKCIRWCWSFLCLLQKYSTDTDIVVNVCPLCDI